MQMIFQDPYSSLNPRKTVGSIIADPFAIHGLKGEGERKRAVQELMDTVGLNPEHYNRYPHEFSGGQRQRIGVARALALKPKMIIADEPVSALDVSIQAQVLNLLRDLQRDLGLTLVFIAHDLSVVRHMCDRVAVMYLGKLVELAELGGALRAPADAVHRRADVRGAGARPGARGPKKRQILTGDVPSPTNPPPACRVPHALLEGPGGLRDGGAAARAQGRRQHRRLPLPADGRGGRRARARGPRAARLVLVVLVVEALRRELVALAVEELDVEEVVAVGVGREQGEAAVDDRALVDGQAGQLRRRDASRRRRGGGPTRASSRPRCRSSPRQPPTTSSQRSSRQSGLRSAVSSVKSADAKNSSGSASASPGAKET